MSKELNPESYTLYLYSGNGTGTDSRSKSFNIDWASLLPREYKKFAVTCLFRSFEDTNHTLDYITITADFSVRLWDSTRKGLGYIIGEASQFTGNTDPIYQTASNSVSDILIEYPQQPNITITLRQVDGTSLPDAGGEWYLFIKFKPVQ
jgi:hypothetical protein